ncbi:DUF1877 family protein [Arthrobacter wenxiniae]|uniref:DUF1877 family protein n=1 Tax=Arthrobacter wenxiniae TaxID=2713570 RepID=A0A7Y7IJY4_9MICC|nr:DUF1877 family protein [Arthrobacter wenxiniae]NVM96843.1 DUF1877 family protein [Arthrobacter wenxiniae]
MGIRYFALPVPAQLVGIARINPRAFLSDHHFWESWSDPPDRPEGLFLDKAWQDLQWLLGPGDAGPARAAYELVRGAVTQYGYGWIPYDRVLDQGQVADVARDLATVSLAAPYQGYTPQFSPDWAAIKDSQCGSLDTYLGKAANFTQQLAEQGLGLIYSIG